MAGANFTRRQFMTNSAVCSAAWTAPLAVARARGGTGKTRQRPGWKDSELNTLSPVAGRLVEAFREMDVIDSHEHMPPETERLKRTVNWQTLLSLTSGNSRPAHIAAAELYGVHKVAESELNLLSGRIAAANTPGIYRRVLRDRGRIRTILTQPYRPKGIDWEFDYWNLDEYDSDLFRMVMGVHTCAAIRTAQRVEQLAGEFGDSVSNLDDYLSVVEKQMKKWQSKGAVAIKMRAFPYPKPDRAQAEDLFHKVMRNQADHLLREDAPAEVQNPLFNFIQDHMFAVARDMGLVFQVHTGLDQQERHPKHMVPILRRHPRTRFDLHHMWLPDVKETMNIGRQYDNAFINLAWCHRCSPTATCTLMDLLLDHVPLHKTIAFGGDYRWEVETVYGELVMAREHLAAVLARRIEQREMTQAKAIAIAGQWFYDNAVEIYGLGKQRD